MTPRRIAAARLLVAALLPVALDAQAPEARPRARDLGIVVGRHAPGPLDAITDVAGVRVGHATVVRGDSVRTGVTVVFPHEGNAFEERVPAALVVGNGFGKFVGATQVMELGELETPVALTCTLCSWRVAESLAAWMLAQPRMQGVRSINPVVGETNDGWALNDIRRIPVGDADVRAAIADAKGGAVAEGSVGAGTGTVAFEWKGGIGTASRVVPRTAGGPYTVGVLVQSNFGGLQDLTILGVPVGRELGRRGVVPNRDQGASGSIVVLVATDAPLSDRSLRRLASRAMLAIGRTGSAVDNGSGDYVLAFSTHPAVRRRHVPGSSGTPPDTLRTLELGNAQVARLFEPVVEATQEAIYNSLLRATTVRGAFATVEALPIAELRAILARYGIGARR